MTKRRHLLLSLFLGVLGSCDRRAPPTPPPAPPPVPAPAPVPQPFAFEKKVVLQVRAETWREGEKPFDIGDALRKKLAAARVDVVAEDAADKNGTVLVEYEETKGQGYSNFGFGNPTHWGTRIRFKMTLLSGNLSDVLTTLEAFHSTPSSVSNIFALYDEALKSFQEGEIFTNSGGFVAAALGVKSSLPKLLPAVVRLDSRMEALKILERAGFQPANAREEAMLALGKEDYARCVAIGTPAVDPLLDFLSHYYWPEHVEKVARALGEIGDRRAAQPLLDRLRGAGDEGTLAITLIEALGKVGDAFALPDLDALAKKEDGNKEIAAAAQRGAEEIRKRLGAK